MRPRLEYYGPLDEIEMELKGARTLKVGDKVKIEGREGKIIHECQALLGRWHVEYEGIPGTCCVSASECIPVEPERVKEDAFPQWHPPCGFQGLCHNGWGSKWCAECPWFDKAPSPGLLQRMGMATWEEEEKDWFVVSKNVGIGTATQLLVRRQDAQEVVTIGTSERRMFRWSDGVQG